MAFLKFSRDKRGYENYYLFEPPRGGRDHIHGGKGRPRLLFWFRTPPQVKVGRTPFSDDVRTLVEAQNPGVSFDWARIVATPIPSAEVDHWRERRRVEKAAKRAAREAEAEDTPVTEEAVADRPEAEPVADAVASVASTAGAAADADGETPTEPQAPASDVQGNPSQGHRRRRRRGRGRRGGQGQPPTSAPPTNGV